MTPSNKKHPVTVERRRHDRLAVDLEAVLSVGLVMADGTVHAAVPVDLSTGGICLRWSPSDMVPLEVGQSVVLRIHPYTAESPITVDAVVRWTGADVDGNIRYGLEFENLFKIFEDVLPALWELCHALHGRR